MTRRGFTLIEVMLAIAITAMIGTLIYGGFAQTALNRSRIEADLIHHRSVQLTLEKMARELSMAYVSTHVNPGTALQTMRTAFIGQDSGDEDRIDFTSFSHRRLYKDTHESDQNEISYFVARHPEEPATRVLARREQKRIDDDPQRGGKVQILLEGIEELDIEYLDPLSAEWVKSWDTTQAVGQANRLPSQVKITIKVTDPQRNIEQVFSTRAALPMTYALNHANYNP